MGDHSAGNRAALGGIMSVLGFTLLFMEGWMRVIGILMLLGGLISIVFALFRAR